MQVNRHLKDKAFDHIDHALGRPIDPMVESYRNSFCTGGKEADDFRQSPYWDEWRTMFESTTFFVNDAGREALKLHLAEIGDKHRLFSIRVDGEEYSPVVAINRGKARYSAWLNISDTWQELTFKDFCKRSSVRLA